MEYQRRYKLRLLVKRQEYSPAECVAMVKQCRREVSKLREIIKKMQAAQRYKYNREWKEKQMRRKYLKPVSHAEAMDYLADTNHAYENDETQAG